ncbi:MAG: ABC transporter permease [Gemmataceae bacterium]
MNLQRFVSVARKELLHILRDPQTLFLTLFFPVLEMFLLGYALDLNVRDIKTIIVDRAGTQESRALVKRFENSDDFRVVAYGFSDDDVKAAMVKGTVRVGIIIPEDYSRRLEAGDSAQVLVAVDGTLSTIASEAINVGNAVALRESLERALGDRPLPVEVRPRVLFNPDTRTPNFFIPGLLVVMCQMMATMLAASAIVREKENGTLEQLYMTPVGRGEFILGKMLPYLVLTILELCFLTVLMRIFFQVPIAGYFLTLVLLALPFMLTMLGCGLLISTRADTREAASQMVMGTLLPSIFLSGYVFSMDSMPTVFWLIGHCLPTTWLVDASRGVILRGAGWNELWLHAVVLWAMALAMLLVVIVKVRKRLA